jgi:hypothetical protein
MYTDVLHDMLFVKTLFSEAKNSVFFSKQVFLMLINGAFSKRCFSHVEKRHFSSKGTFHKL